VFWSFLELPKALTVIKGFISFLKSCLPNATPLVTNSEMIQPFPDPYKTQSTGPNV
jgi:hypothetical protein